MTLDRVLAANEPYWAAEAEICRTYFRSAARTLDRDLLWLRRQAAKELFDGVEVMDGARREEEREHLRLFVAAYDRLRRPGDPPADREQLAADVAWPANAALSALRRRHREEAGRLGAVAALVTEGGRGALFAEGAALAGGGGVDDVIADACAAVHADELAHMEAGLDELAALDLSAAEWDAVVELTVAQSRQRLVMRDEQFGGAVEPARLRALLAHGPMDGAPSVDRRAPQAAPSRAPASRRSPRRRRMRRSGPA